MLHTALISRLCEVTERSLKPKVPKQSFYCFNVGLISYYSARHFKRGIPYDRETMFMIPSDLEQGRALLKAYTVSAVRNNMSVGHYCRKHETLYQNIKTEFEPITNIKIREYTKLREFLNER